MAKLGDVYVLINGDDKGLRSTLSKTERDTRSWASRVGGGIKGALTTAIGTAAGFMAAQVGLRAIGNLVTSVRKSTIDMNAELETTQLQFTTLMGDAERAAAHVEDLFDFAKATPFETGPIIEASLRLQQFGGDALNSRENLSLLGDAAAATNAPLQDLSLWVGRLYSGIQIGEPVGEATRRLQELAVLSPQARVEITRLTEAGADASEVWAVLERDLERFNGAMGRQANTWQGLTSTISDSVQLLAATAFRPLFDLGRRALKTIADALDSEAVEQGAENVAAALQRIIDRMGQTVRGWLTAFTSIERETIARIGRIAGFLTSFAQFVVSWGSNVVNLLAQGIRLAVGAVTTALQFLGQVITYFLKPGSPPRLLPDLDKWGTGAAEAWLEGWLEADYSALEDFGRTVQGLLSSMAAAGRIDESEVAPRTQGVREGFAEILQSIRETGTVSDELFTAIREQAGSAGEEVEGLARRYARVAAVSLRLAEIQGRLNDMTREQEGRYDTARLGQLDQIIADPRATAGQRERAQAERERIGLLAEQRDLEAELEDAQAELGSFKARISVEEQTLSLMGQQLSLIESIQGALTNLIDPLTQAVRGWQLQQSELRDLVRLAEIEHLLAGEDLTVAERTALELEKQAIQAERLVRARDAAEIGVDLSGLANIPIVPEDFLSSAKAAKDALGMPDGIEGAAMGALEGLEELTGFDLSEFTTELDEMKLAFQIGLEEGQAYFEGLTGESGTFSGALGNLDSTMESLGETLELLDLRLGELRTSLEEGGEASETARGIGTRLADAVKDVWTDPVNELRDSWDELKESWNELREVASPLIEKAEEVIGVIETLWDKVGRDKSKGLIASLFDAGGTMLWLQNPIDVLKGWLDDLRRGVDAVASAVEWAIDAWNRLRGVDKSGATAPPPEETWGGSQAASGTAYAQGGLTMVGEMGREMMYVPEGARIWSAGQTERMLAGRAQYITVTVPGVVVRNEQDVHELAWQVAREIQWRSR